MCGRFFLIIDIKKLQNRYGINEEIDYNYEASGEIFPTNTVPTVIQKNKSKFLIPCKWGFSPPYLNKPVINARAETIDKKKIFRESFFEKRCLIPVNHFYEWKKTGNKNIKYKIELKENSIFSFAGIYQKFQNKEGEIFNYFSIITTKPNQKIKPIHNRMPVILEKNNEKHWLNPENNFKSSLKDMLVPYNNNEINIEKENGQLKFPFRL